MSLGARWSGREGAQSAAKKAWRQLQKSTDAQQAIYDQYYPDLGNRYQPWEDVGLGAAQRIGAETFGSGYQGMDSAPYESRLGDINEGFSGPGIPGQPNLPQANALARNYSVQDFNAPMASAGNASYNLDFDKYANDPRLKQMYDIRAEDERRAIQRAGASRGNFLSSFNANQELQSQRYLDAERQQQALGIAQQVAQGNLSASQTNAGLQTQASLANQAAAMRAQQLQQEADRGYALDQYGMAEGDYNRALGREQQQFQNALTGYGLAYGAESDRFKRGFDTSVAQYNMASDANRQNNQFGQNAAGQSYNALLGLANLGYGATGQMTGFDAAYMQQLADLEAQRGAIDAQKYGTYANLGTNFSNNALSGQIANGVAQVMSAWRGGSPGQSAVPTNTNMQFTANPTSTTSPQGMQTGGYSLNNGVSDTGSFNYGNFSTMDQGRSSPVTYSNYSISEPQIVGQGVGLNNLQNVYSRNDNWSGSNPYNYYGGIYG